VAKVAFLARSLDLRGTGVATYDYAEGVEACLGGEAVVLFDATAEQAPAALARFQNRFRTAPYEGLADADRVIEGERADLVHVMKGDARDRWVSRAAATAVHQVFLAAAADAHGSAYAYVSRWLAQVCAGPRAPAVPHIVALAAANGDWRQALAIPSDALVLGCHGGAASFDVAFAQRALARSLESRRDLYFVGLNLSPFLNHERAFFIPGIADASEKRRFLDTCDAMLHARRRGETFGLAVAEFSAANRPVLTYSGSPERAHLAMLGDAAMTYRSERDLLALLAGLDRRALKQRDWDRYSAAYAQAPVMRQFDEAFVRRPLDPARIRRFSAAPDALSPSGLWRHMRRTLRRWKGKGG
jgi:hypothetical protein